MAPWLIQLLIFIGTYILTVIVGTRAALKTGGFVGDGDNVYAKANLAYSTRAFTFGALIVLLAILLYKWTSAQFIIYIALVVSASLIILMASFLLDALKSRNGVHRRRLIPNAIVFILGAVAMLLNVAYNLLTPVLS